MQLLLLSWGTGALLSQIPPGSRLGYIPTAAEPYPDKSIANEMRRRLVGLGYVLDDIEVSAQSSASIEAAIEASDALFVSGGNTFYLLQQLRAKGADRMIAAHVAAGKLYIGASAGSVIMAPDIDPVRLLDDPAAAPDLASTAGLGLLDYLIIPHVDDPISGSAETLARLDREYGATVPMVRLRDDQAILARSPSDRTIIPSP